MFNFSPKWNFPSNNNGPILGIADSGVETFKGTPIKSLAREICQNSLDARLDDSKPTKIEFKTFDIDPKSIPDYSNFEDAFNRSLDFWSIQESTQAKKFFTRALKGLRSSSIKCLRISDFNTSGLTGSHEEYNSPWCNLTKSSGASDKSGSRGGSFGIGKFAPFACSSLRTVFYSTYDVHGTSASQGVARLTSFKNKKKETTQGIGFYGDDKKNMPMYKQYSLDSQYTRSESNTGTDIFVVGFTGEKGWEHQFVASILDGFLYAVYTGALTVDVDGVTISKETLPELMVSHKDYFKEHADEYYRVLTDEENARTFTCELKDNPETEGTLTLRLMIEPTFNRRVAMIRQTGMKIKDKGNINGIIPFAGTLFIEGDALNSYLRNLENPQHLEWELDRADNKRQASQLMKSMLGFIKESLDKMKDEAAEEELDPSVGEYLSANEADDTANQDRAEAISDEIKEIKIRVVDIAPPKPAGSDVSNVGQTTVDAPDGGEVTVTDLPGEGGSGSAGSGGSGGNGGGSNPGNGGGKVPIEHPKKFVSVAASRIRNVIKDKSTGCYTIVFTPLISAENGIMDVFMSAESQNYEAAIINASCADCPNLKISKNRISNLIFTEKKPLRIEIQLDYHDYCSMEVKAYGNQV